MEEHKTDLELFFSDYKKFTTEGNIYTAYIPSGYIIIYDKEDIITIAKGYIVDENPGRVAISKILYQFNNDEEERFVNNMPLIQFVNSIPLTQPEFNNALKQLEDKL